jgi:serine/threonine protein phosphatase PrpC
MLRISEHYYVSDLGRQRQGNEDNYFVRAPLFVVADGMGGAQAGEVASEMAVESFEESLPDGSPSTTLAEVIRGANRRIHDRSRSSEEYAGMGTTVTAAYVGESDVTVAHVGDSRAYLWRDGELVRLTRDHSLVGELVARGKLTEEQAEAHPQRNVITRALGAEPDVQVDVEVFDARDGDVFLLCSDGLTGMIHEPGVRPVLERARDLEQAGRELIAAANEAGGRDNITVILFRIEEVGTAEGQAVASAEAPEPETSEYDTFAGEAVAEPRQGVSRAEGHTRVRDEEALQAGDVAHAVQAANTTEEEYRASGTVALAAITPRPESAGAAEPGAPERTAPLPDGTPPSVSTSGSSPASPRPPDRAARKRRRLRVPGPLIFALILLAMVVGGFWLASRAVYFIGTDAQSGDTVTIYRGLPIDLPLGLDLYSRYAGSGVTLQSIPAARRATFTDHKLRSRDDAENLVIALERGQIVP